MIQKTKEEYKSMSDNFFCFLRQFKLKGMQDDASDAEIAIAEAILSVHSVEIETYADAGFWLYENKQIIIQALRAYSGDNPDARQAIHTFPGMRPFIRRKKGTD